MSSPKQKRVLKYVRKFETHLLECARCQNDADSEFCSSGVRLLNNVQRIKTDLPVT